MLKKVLELQEPSSRVKIGGHLGIKLGFKIDFFLQFLKNGKSSKFYNMQIDMGKAHNFVSERTN